MCIVCFRSQPNGARLKCLHVSGKQAFKNIVVGYSAPLTSKLLFHHLIKSKLVLPVLSRLSCLTICLFVCMNTRAIHLVLVFDLSTPTFLNALKRFVGWRE